MPDELNAPAQPSPLAQDIDPATAEWLLRSANNPLQGMTHEAAKPLPPALALLQSTPSWTDRARAFEAQMQGRGLRMTPEDVQVGVDLSSGFTAGTVRAVRTAPAARSLADIAAESFRGALPRTMPAEHSDAILRGIRDALDADWDSSANMPREGSGWRPANWSDLPLQPVGRTPANYSSDDIGLVQGSSPNRQHVVANGRRIADIVGSGATYRVDIAGIDPPHDSVFFPSVESARNYATDAHNHQLPSQQAFQPTRMPSSGLSDADIEAHLATNPGASIFDVAGVTEPPSSRSAPLPSTVYHPWFGETTQRAVDMFNTHIAPHYTPSEFSDQFFAGMHDPSLISMEHLPADDAVGRVSHGPGLAFVGQLSVGNNPVGRIERVLYPESGYAEHHYLKLDDELQGSGVAKDLLAGQVSAYRKMGFNSVGVGANINVGGYAWAKYGFVPSKFDWNFIREHGKTLKYVDSISDPAVKSNVTSILNSDDPKSIWDLADIKATGPDGKPIGKALLMNRSWHGELNLNDADTMDRFNAYVGQKGK